MNFYRIILFILISTVMVSVYALPSEKFNFIALADIHFDPYTACPKNKVCPLIVKLRDAPVSAWPKLLAQYDMKPAEYLQDTNYGLLHSALSASEQVAKAGHSQFVLVLGDSLGHEYRRKYKRYSGDASGGNYPAFARKVFAFLTNQIAAAFPSIDVYTVVGNNDSYQGDYVIKPDGPFFAETGALWSSLVKNASSQAVMRRQFSHAGYYAIELTNPENLRLIVLNTNLFSPKAKGRNLDAIASQQLNWLHDELQKARDAQQKVFIAIHIPQGIDLYATQKMRLFRVISLWKTQYIDRFENELKEYSAEIAGIFSGHLHRNWYQVLTLDDHEIPVIGVTAISPISGNNPGFRNITYFTSPIRLDDIATYSFPVNGGTWTAERHAKITPS